MTADTVNKGAWIGSVCLVVLVFQNSLFFLATHEGRVPDENGHTYYAPSMVVLVELFKAMISFGILFYTQYKAQSISQSIPQSNEYTSLPNASVTSFHAGSTANDADDVQSEKMTLDANRVRGTMSNVSSLIFSKTAWRLAIPATLYVIQTNLAVIGAQNLDATTFMVASQLKFATTALCTSFMLKRVIGVKRWISLGTLSLGVVLVQLAGQNAPVTDLTKSRNPILGLISIVVACFISGFASVFLEKILKNANTNLWATNIQLGSFGVIPALLPCVVDAWRNGLFHPFMYFGFWAWTTVFANVMGGLVVALIMKYADNIQKSLAISASIVLTFLVCVALGRAEFQITAMMGAAIVIASIIAYNRVGQVQSAPAKPVDQTVDVPQNQPLLEKEDDELELTHVSVHGRERPSQ